MLKRSLALIFAMMLTMPVTTSRAAGIPVIDAANLVQAVQQLLSMYREYELLFNQYRDFVENIKHFDAERFLLGYLVGRDPRLGRSFLAQARFLDPDHPQWKSDLQTLLVRHYALLDEHEAGTLISQAFRRPDNVAYYNDLYQRRDAELEPIYDAYAWQGYQQRVSEIRQEQLERLKGTFSGMGSRSALKQQQATNGLLFLMAQQAEANQDAMAMLAGLQVQQRLRAQSNLERARQAELQRLATVRDRLDFDCGDNCARVW